MSELYKDYAKLRKAIGTVQKGGKNPHFKNTYVELNTAIDVVEEKLEENNFVCFLQIPTTKEGKNYLNTKLIHNSGEIIEGDLELITTRQDPQMLGSSLTYARRYSLLTILGLKAEDDDGNKASGKVDIKKETNKINKFTDSDKLITYVKESNLPENLKKIARTKLAELTAK